MRFAASTTHWSPKGSNVFIRWGLVIALIGIVLTFTAFRGMRFGAILIVAGVAVYYYGRFVRKERIFVSRR